MSNWSLKCYIFLFLWYLIFYVPVPCFICWRSGVIFRSSSTTPWKLDAANENPFMASNYFTAWYHNTIILLTKGHCSIMNTITYKGLLYLTNLDSGLVEWSQTYSVDNDYDNKICMLVWNPQKLIAFVAVQKKSRKMLFSFYIIIPDQSPMSS